MPASDRYQRNNPRHRILLEYTAYGKSADEIAQATGFAVPYVRAVQRSPLFQTEVEQVQAANKQHTLRKFAETLAEETMPSLTTIKGIRDDVNARNIDRVTAADKMIGRALELYAPRNQGDDGKRTVKLVIEGGDLAGLMAAVREVDGKPPLEITASAEHTDDADPNARIRPVTIDEMEADEPIVRDWDMR